MWSWQSCYTETEVLQRSLSDIDSVTDCLKKLADVSSLTFREEDNLIGCFDQTQLVLGYELHPQAIHIKSSITNLSLYGFLELVLQQHPDLFERDVVRLVWQSIKTSAAIARI